MSDYYELEYKPDWPKSQERLEAFWAGEIIDRAVISIVAPREPSTCLPQLGRRHWAVRPTPKVGADEFCIGDYQAEVGRPVPVPTPQTWEALWCDPDYIINATHAVCAAHFYGGEAAPRPLRLNVGLATYGRVRRFTSETIWIDPELAHKPLSSYRFDPENRWWKCTLDLMQALVEDGRGKYIVPMPDILTPVETLANLRGASNLCMDLVDRPGEVHQLLDYLLAIHRWQYGILDGVLDVNNWGAMCALNIWAPGKTILLSCDFCALIGPQHFEEFVVPQIGHILETIDHSLFHLDGPHALRHLPRLLEIDALDGIQWSPGKGQPMAMEGLAWLDVLKRIQSSGKLLQIIIRYQDIESTLEHLDPRGLFLWCKGVPNPDTAQRLLECVAKWSCRRRWAHTITRKHLNAGFDRQAYAN